MARTGSKLLVRPTNGQPGVKTAARPDSIAQADQAVAVLMATELMSTRAPTPIVEDTASLRR
jgi:hypothetical protein